MPWASSGSSAAADGGLAKAVDDVAADGADIELGPERIAREVAVDYILARQQLDDRHRELSGQRLKQSYVGIAATRFP